MRADDALRLSARVRQLGAREAARRIVRRLASRMEIAELAFPLLPDDLADSALVRAARDRTLQAPRGEGPLTVGWLCTPPSRGSGGHTTMFRMIAAIERAGHRCVVLLYDRHGGDSLGQAEVVRSGWPWIEAEVRSVSAGFGGIDICVATGWPTAHVLASRAPDTLPCGYFIQDYEPFFYAHGSEYELAADTYRFGFTNIALGEMVRRRLATELGVDSHMVPFSVDTAVYELANRGPRSGVVLYAKPDVPRRGYRLAARALEEFHARCPEQEIHVYGDPVPDIGVPVTRHGRLSPAELNALYNRCIAGFALSFTNISLVAEEMLAAGCLPVVNDSPDSRADLDHPSVVWAPPTPHALAEALARVVGAAGPADALRAAAGVRHDDWSLAGRKVLDILLAEHGARLGANLS
jgi:glycosyltransferase involved in cell wall biosynthesis